MKFFRLLFILPFLYLLSGCENEDSTTSLSVSMAYYWGNEKIVQDDLNQFKYTNSAGNLISITDLKFIISNFIIKRSENQISELLSPHGYYKVLSNQIEPYPFSSSLINISGLKAREEYQISFVFGFEGSTFWNPDYTIDTIEDMNWPEDLGGGYNSMKFNGSFIDANGVEKPFEYYMGPNVKFNVDFNRFTLNKHTHLELKMDLKEWFNNPVPWNLNTRHIDLMSDPDIQMAMRQNGQTVFSIRKTN